MHLTLCASVARSQADAVLLDAFSALETFPEEMRSVICAYALPGETVRVRTRRAVVQAVEDFIAAAGSSTTSSSSTSTSASSTSSASSGTSTTTTTSTTSTSH
jgi:hypothetical protein